ncbi:hypothetical protein [Dactylococcopsis salina]|nr:hypothetical protein [Dactylococcopsis salina]
MDSKTPIAIRGSTQRDRERKTLLRNFGNYKRSEVMGNFVD